MSLIVLIEDNLDNSRLAARLLASQHEVLIENEGEAGLSLVFDTHPDLVLVDLGLPDVDGQAIIGMIRQTQALSQTRVVAFTAYPEEVANEIARVYGCDGIINKPINTRYFLTQVNAFLEAAPTAQG